MRNRKCLVLSASILFGFMINSFIFSDLRVTSFSRKRFIEKNPLESIDFRFLIYNGQCSKGDGPFVVLLITSYSGNVEAREAIRRAYPVAELRKLGVIRVFLLAKLNKSQSKIGPDRIFNESQQFGDILFGDFFESYRNLTYKHLMGLKWAGEACPSARYIAKMDDDIVVDLYKLSEIIKIEENRRNITLMGFFFGGMEVSRERSNKWFVSEAEYSENYFPAFLSGWLYVTTPAIASRLVSVSRSVPFLWVDDVYVTGLLAREADIPHQNISRYFSRLTEHIHCCIRDKILCNYVAGPSNGYYAMHNSFKRWTDDCKRGLCKPLPLDKTLADICTINWHLPVDRGKSIVQQIQISV